MKTGQHQFYAPFDSSGRDNESGTHSKRCAAVSPARSCAEKDGTLYAMGSTYSHENEAVYDGISRSGARIVTFAPILKQKLFPCPIL
jgi:hypothetical protein